MVANRNVNKRLEDHEKRISSLESLIRKPKDVKKSSKKFLSDYIIDLRNSGFFSEPKTAEETHTKLKGSYHCELNRVAVALIRHAEKKQLRKASKFIDKKKYKAFVW